MENVKTRIVLSSIYLPFDSIWDRALRKVKSKEQSLYFAEYRG